MTTEQENDDYLSDSSESEGGISSEETIGVFGGHGATGKHFIKLALDAGYAVQALAPSSRDIDLRNERLRVVQGSLSNVDEIAQVVDNATYVVCMLGDTLPSKQKDYKADTLSAFVQKLYPLMKESCTRLFLYQANSLTVDASGKVPIFSRVLKETSNVLGMSPVVKDNDKVVKFIVENASEYFHYIVTRPGILRDGPSKKRLAASRSLPGPVPVHNVDLAEFSLSALMDESIYDKTPYVVGDGF